MARQKIIQTREQPDSPERQPDRPTRWWQWLLIYPALAISLLTAAPQWLDKIQALTASIGDRSFKEAQEQSDLFRKNLTCTEFPDDWYVAPGNVNVDATICESGDIYVRAQAPGQQPSYYWVPVERVVGSPKQAGAAQTALFLPERGLAKLAFPSHPDGSTHQVAPRPAPQQQQASISVVCTKFVDNRHVLRHLSTSAGCVDQIVDSFTGQTVSSTKVACRTTC